MLVIHYKLPNPRALLPRLLPVKVFLFGLGIQKTDEMIDHKILVWFFQVIICPPTVTSSGCTWFNSFQR